MLNHGVIYIRSDLQAVPPHPLSIANQDSVGGCLDQALTQKSHWNIQVHEAQVYKLQP